MHTPFVSAIFSFFWLFHSPTVKTRAPIFTKNTPKDAVPRKDVLLGVAKPVFKILAPFHPETRRFWDRNSAEKAL